MGNENTSLEPGQVTGPEIVTARNYPSLQASGGEGLCGWQRVELGM